MCTDIHDKSNNKIFISIASFMDPLLENTIENMISTAKNPDNLVFGIIIQDTEERRSQFSEKYSKRHNFKIISIPSEESQGCCWARSQVQQLMSDEAFFMQTDSHHVYVKHWDILCIHMLDQCVTQSKHNKVVLSTYGTPAKLPDFKCTHEDTAFYMKCERFYNIPKVRYVPEKVKKLQQPQLWHTISAHFLFTHSQWVRDVPYDPELYFDGEEDTLALRSYTRGYDIYYPHAKISYHYYTRKGEKRHSDIDKTWYKINDKSIKRLNDILSGKIKGKFGLGDVKTLNDYKEFTDIDYLNKIILTPETHKFGNSTFIKKGFEWSENNKYQFKELENSDEFFLLYDYNRKLYAKLHKLKRTFQVSNDLINWELIGPNNENKHILVYGNNTFTKDLITNVWTESGEHQTHNFVEKEDTSSHYLLFDESRSMSVRLYKDLSCYEVSWPPENKFVSLYGTPKTLIVSPQAHTPKPKIPSHENYFFGPLHFSKINKIQWQEKSTKMIFKEIIDNEEYIMLQASLIYRIHKNMKTVDIQNHEKTWVPIYANGTTNSTTNDNVNKPIAQIAPESDLKTFKIERKSDITIICVGDGKLDHYDEAIKNHMRYTKYFKYNYYYYDRKYAYDPKLIHLHSTNVKYILYITLNSIFTKFERISAIGKHLNSNVLCTSFDDQTIQNNFILFKMNMHGTSSYIDLFSNPVFINKKPDGVKLLEHNKLGSNFSNHTKHCFALVLNMMKPEQVKENFEKWNKQLKI